MTYTLENDLDYGIKMNFAGDTRMMIYFLSCQTDPE